jgi:hypothetical protein
VSSRNVGQLEWAQDTDSESRQNRRELVPAGSRYPPIASWDDMARDPGCNDARCTGYGRNPTGMPSQFKNRAWCPWNLEKNFGRTKISCTSLLTFQTGLVNFNSKGINAGVLTTQCCEAFLPYKLKAKKKLKLEI